MNATLTFDSILSQVMSMSPDARIELAERIIAGTPEDADREAAQLAEVRRRIADDRAGVTRTISGDEALSQVRSAVLGKS
ncbi:MAG: addiction module protein [Verrucomicrobiaceae bacterium]